MYKSELVAKLAEKAESTQSAAAKFIDAFTAVITEALKEGDSVALTGFGTFEVKERAAKEGINPLTKEKIHIEACKVPAFKASKTLKTTVNG